MVMTCPSPGQSCGQIFTTSHPFPIPDVPRAPGTLSHSCRPHMSIDPSLNHTRPLDLAPPDSQAVTTSQGPTAASPFFTPQSSRPRCPYFTPNSTVRISYLHGRGHFSRVVGFVELPLEDQDHLPPELPRWKLLLHFTSFQTWEPPRRWSPSFSRVPRSRHKSSRRPDHPVHIYHWTCWPGRLSPHFAEREERPRRCASRSRFLSDTRGFRC